jgi:hypothetical protein
MYFHPINIKNYAYNRLIISIILCCIWLDLNSQVLSNLHCSKEDAVYTVYAASLERSDYTIDQAYSLSWLDPEKWVGFESKDGGGFGLGFMIDSIIVGKLKQCYREPVITISYPDLVKFYYYPRKDIRLEVFFAVYSSSSCIAEITLHNETGHTLDLSAVNMIEPGIVTVDTEDPHTGKNYSVLSHHKSRDSWMKEHEIPYAENLRSVWLCTAQKVSVREYKQYVPLIIPKDSLASFRIVRVTRSQTTEVSKLIKEAEKIKTIDLWDLVKNNEKLFTHLPTFKMYSERSASIHSGEEVEIQLLALSCFNLMHQCMMGPEGECKENYYVFSREPKWGWGYGGQVFHESLSMIAYARLNPAGAMNSQRVFMQRQHEDGYINYRTGPYLNEKIENKGKLTSSAPWFNYENWEIFRITGDKSFLSEAYRSGKKFIEWFILNHDTDKDGLYEWGGDAELESVRDARVAVWDEVCKPEEVEGPDINSMLVKEAKCLASMAMELGYPAEAHQWQIMADNLIQLINKWMWDVHTGFYYNINKNTHTFTIKHTDDLKRMEIIGFLPLWAGVATEDIARELLLHLRNPNQFKRPFGIPTLSANDPYYNPLGYWNGPVWIPWQYLIFRGLIDYGYHDDARDLSVRVAQNVLYQLKQNHYFWEFYSPDDLQAGWNKSYIWTGLLSEMIKQ